MNVVALILAAGSGNRFDGQLPKQYCYLDDDIILNKAVKAFSEIKEIDAVQVVISEECLKLYSDEICDDKKLLPVCFGGKTRQESAKLGLEAIRKFNPDKVLIHDAARPYVQGELIKNILLHLNEYKAVDVAVPIVDTVKSKKDGRITLLNREDLYKTQTPQGFKYREILHAHLNTTQTSATDDVMLMIEQGHEISIVPGDSANIKITYSKDVDYNHNKDGYMRIGNGFDVHKFSDQEGSYDIKLGGVDIKHTHTLIAHSDGDVVLHALTDALLGAIAAGDIGDHFPPSDERWRNADSIMFLQHAHSLVRDKKGAILNIDITIICELPKVSPHKVAIKQKIANILSIDEDMVSVKATTTEKLGFTGRKEGIAAQAVCLLKIAA